MTKLLKQEQQKKETLFSSFCRFWQYLLDYIICIYMLLIIVVLPFYNEEGYQHIGTDKHKFFRACFTYTGYALFPVLGCYLICKCIRFWREEKGNWKEAVKSGLRSLSITDFFALLYGSSLVISYLCTPYRESAKWGALGWYMGLIPQLALVATYFCISRLWKKRDWMFLLFLPVSAVTFVLGYLNRFGIYPIDMQPRLYNFISTVGNINWYCGYMVTVMFIGVYLFWKTTEDRTKRLAALYVTIAFAALVTQGSMSGFMALGVVLVLLFCMSASDAGHMLLFWQEILLLAVACLFTWGVRVLWPNAITFSDAVMDLFTNSCFPLLMAALAVLFLVYIPYTNRKGCYPKRTFSRLASVVGCGTALTVCVVIGMIVKNTLYPGSIGPFSDNDFFTFSPEWGSLRGASWKAAIMCLREEGWLQRLVGVGPDCMEQFISHEGSLEMRELLQRAFEGLRLTNAHCEWLTIWIDLGVIGLIGYVGMISSAVVRFLANKKGNTFITGACGLCVLAYTVNNFVSFQQSMSVATVFVILGIGEAYTSGRNRE